MLDIKQKYKDLYSTYGGKSIRLVFYKEKYYTPYPSSDTYPSYTLQPSRAIENVVDFVISDDMIHADSLEFEESLCSKTDLDFGACESTKMEIVVSGDKYIRALYPGQTVHPSENLVPADNIVGREFALIESFFGTDKIYPNKKLHPSDRIFPSKDIVRGIFTVDSTPREDDRNTRKIIAYDRMKKFDKDISDWYEKLNFPMTLKEFRDAFCNYIKIPVVKTNLVNDNMIVEKTLDTETFNGRDLIRYICQINGVFGNVNHKGKFRYVKIPKKSKISDTITRYKSVESEEYTVPDIDTVKIRQEEGDIGGTSGGNEENSYIIEGNILAFGKTTSQLKQIANNIKSLVSGLEYRPAIIEGSGAPWYEVGDRIIVKTSDGDVNTIIMSRVSSGIQGPMEVVKSTGSPKLKQTFSIQSQIVQVKGLTAKIKFTVEEVSSELKNFEKQTTSKFTQTADQITAEVKRASDAEASLKVYADGISTDVRNFKENTSSQFHQTAEQITQEVTRATEAEGKLSARIQINAGAITQRVTSAQAESLIEQKADSIRLKANAISWSSNNSSMTADGKLTCKEASVSGNIMAGSGKIGGFNIDRNSLVTRADDAKIDFGDVVIDNTGLLAFNWWFSETEISCMAGIIANDDGDLIVHGSQYYDKNTVAEALDDLRRRIGGGGGGCGSECSGECNQECSCDGDCNEDLECDIDSGTICVGGG